MTTWPDAAKNVPKPQGGGFMRLKQGANKFRVLSAPVMGYEYWVEKEGKPSPVRVKEYPVALPGNLKKDSKIKFFWAFIVWNFDTKAVEILELTQSSIIAAIQALVNSEEWGSPEGYTITVTRTGEKLDTEYSITPSIPKPVPSEVTDAFKSKVIRLEALFDGSNPFEAPGAKSDVTDDATAEANAAYEDMGEQGF